MPAANAADQPREGRLAQSYPEHPTNPVPRGGTEAEWKAWADELTSFQLFGVHCTHFSPELVRFEVLEHVAAPNPIGSVHGGVLAAMLDDAFGVAFIAAAPDDVLPATASLTVDYVRPAFLPLTIEARATSVGRSLVHCEAVVQGADGRVTNRGRAIMAAKRIVALPAD